QEDVVQEVVDIIKGGTKVIFIHGTCGTGKSAIALNIARQLGRAAIVVPIKSLQKQYEDDYKTRKYLIKPNGFKMRIAMITGRENHDSVFIPGISCADSSLPDTIQITEKNMPQLREYYLQNPFISTKIEPNARDLRRISIAPANPYWSPIVPANYELKQLKDAKKKHYRGLQGKEFIFYHRKEGCTYYDQYQAYLDADVIIFNAAKYKIEMAIGRKPETEVDIIDEADEFLDSLTNEQEINITRLAHSLNQIMPESEKVNQTKDQIVDLIRLEEKNKQALGIREDDLFKIKDTKLERIIQLIANNPELISEISIDEANYSNKAVEMALQFVDFLEDTYVSFRKHEDNIYASLASIDISKQFKEIIDKNKALVLMSGTIHSLDVLKNIFGLKDFKIVEAEHLNQGSLEIHRTGKEFDCRHSNLSSNLYSRRDYLLSLSSCLEKAKKPALVHVQAFQDLPTDGEITELGIMSLMSREQLFAAQQSDRIGRLISMFKGGKMPALFTTKCSRGIDFPGDMCNSVVFTKYPNPNIKDTFWKILKQTHPTHFWEFYKDKARREFLQRIYRAVRSKEDHVYILSPDIRVIDAVRELQVYNDLNKK
ncbi:MAG: helicase C-terminal domain-containing protein, partial [Nanoarchaeota archaeon]|nr:helicase C-terminal domain-containing protein [Nanoarchaeota archaeon]